MDGWIKLHRKLLRSDMYQQLNSRQRDVLIQCLLLANHKPKSWEYQGQIYQLRAGQFITSLRSLTKRCAKDVNIRTVRTAVSKLETWGFLTHQPTQNNSLITICNWDKYQNEDNYSDTLTDTSPTHCRHTSDTAPTPNNKVKKEKKEKEREEIAQPTPVFNSSDKDNSNSTDSTGSSHTDTVAEAQLKGRLLAEYTRRFPRYQYNQHEQRHLEELLHKLLGFSGEALPKEERAERAFTLFTYMLSHLPPWMQERGMTTLPDLNTHFNKITAYYAAMG